MSSIRNRGNAEDSYLDAARDCILDVGVKRTTMTDIARRAGVARMTIYRKWPDMLTLLGDLMVREWLGEAEAIRTNDTGIPRDARKLAGLIADVSLAMRENPLFRKIVDVDPEFLLPYLLHRRGRTQDALLEMVTTALRDGQSAGTIRAGDPGIIARSILLTTIGFTASMRTMTHDTDPNALDAELRIQLERYLAP